MIEQIDLSQVKPEEVQEFLAANCDIETMTRYIEPFTEEERNTEKVLLAGKTQEVFDKENEIKTAIEPLKEELKNLKEEQTEQFQILKVGGYPREGVVYVFMMDDGRAQIYSDNGRLVDVRPLTDEERQSRIKIV